MSLRHLIFGDAKTKSGKHLLPYRFKTEEQSMLTKDLSSTILCLCLLANVGPDAFVSGRRRICVWDERRSRLGYDTDESGTRSPTSWDAGFATCVFWGQVGESVCSFSRQRVGEKTRDFECWPVFCCIFVVASGQAGEEVPLFSNT